MAPWIGLAIVQIAFFVGIWKFSILSIQASIWSRQGHALLQKSQIDLGYRLLKRAALLATPYGEEQTYYLSRNLIGLAKAGTLEGHAGWLEMYDFNKELSHRQLELHPGNTHKVLIFARYVQELIPLLPRERRDAETQLALSLYQHAIETSPERQHIYFGLGQFHLDRDDPERALGAFETALSFNENIGDSWWRVGRLKWSDMNDSEGAKDILNALDASTPYQFRTADEALIVAEIARIEGRQDLLDDVMIQIPSLRGGSADLFLGIAREFERADRIEDRDRILAVLVRSGSKMKAMLSALRAGLVTTIDESISRFESDVELRPERSDTGPREDRRIVNSSSVFSTSESRLLTSDSSPGKTGGFGNVSRSKRPPERGEGAPFEA